MIRVPAGLPEEFQADRSPACTPAGRPVPQGARADSFAETLTLVAAGRSVFPVGEHVVRFYPRPDIAYIPLHDAPPIRWGPMWLKTNTTQRVRAFVQAAQDATHPGQ
ncbi:LysR substrate-binding domain-containing protein [Nonomuraea polychroma]|uniref:LysR substrate-binding domain-containing protein n=1 Tax=Nonomuraea polychroma TaxID=46176 RepID=UPI003D8D1524